MRTAFLGFVFFLCTVCHLAADTVPFALHDLDGNSSFGQILELTPERIVFQTEDGEKKEFTTKKVAKLENLLRNPFASTEVMPERAVRPITLDRLGRPTYNPIPPTNQPASGNRIVPLLRQRKEAETLVDDTKAKFPNSVVVVELTDGSRLLATELTAKGKTATLRLFPHGELTQPLDCLVAVRLAVGNPAQVIDPPADWLKLLTQPSTKGDRLVVGTAGALDAHEGILHEIGDETIRFTVDGDSLPIPRRRVFGLIFHQPEPPRPDRPFARLACWNGTFLALETLEAQAPPPEEEGTLVWTTLGGAEGTSRLADVVEIVFETTGAVLLNALTPGRVEQALPFVWEKEEVAAASPPALFQRLRANRLQQGGEPPPLDPILEQVIKRRMPGDIRSAKIAELPIPDFQGIELNGTVYRQGLVVPAKTTLVFPLKEPYKAFTAKVGIDDRIRPEGQARLTIFGGELLLFDTIVYGDEPAQSIRLDIENCRKLTLSVDFLDGNSRAAVLSLVELKLTEE